MILPMVSIFPESSLERLRSILGSDLDGLRGDQVQALVTADVEGSVTNLRLQQFSPSHTADISKMLSSLVGTGQLVKDGYGRWASYRLNPGRFLGSEGFTSDELPDAESNLNSSSPNIDGSSPNIDASSPNIDPAVVDAKLLAISAPSREKSRLRPEETEGLILALCRGRFLTYQQIGGLLGRVPRATRDRFLTPMVADGRLRARFPEDMTHPQQSYTATETEN